MIGLFPRPLGTNKNLRPIVSFAQYPEYLLTTARSKRACIRRKLMIKTQPKLSKFEQQILDLSRATNIEAAVSEWVSTGIRTLPNTIKSICGHRVRNASAIRNRITGAVMLVGKTCGEKLLARTASMAGTVLTAEKVRKVRKRRKDRKAGTACLLCGR
jgi:uncharacterized protein YbcI